MSRWLLLRLLRESKYFTLILDEDPLGGLPERAPPEAGELPEAEEQVLWRTAHVARIGVWDLLDNKPLLKLRAHADAKFVPIGESAEVNAEVRRAQQRQVNSCALAAALREAITAKGKTP